MPYGPLPRDTDFEILEIKRADEKLIVKKRRGVRKVSAELAYGISQLRQARKSLQDPRNEELVANTPGRAVKHPRLGLIIGRTPDDEELLELDEQQSFYPDVRITTWDQIVERQARRLPKEGSGVSEVFFESSEEFSSLSQFRSRKRR